MTVSFQADICREMFFIKKSFGQQPSKIFINVMVFAPLTNTTMWHIFTFKPTPLCEPNSQSSLTTDMSYLTIGQRKMQCPECHSENPAGSKFCKESGSKLEIACPNCNTVNPAGSKSGNECGQNLIGFG
ncbi:MAG: zinc ribbon domain-containing protein [Desulfobacteraceae bacterium]|jgi:hypothetical protein|nr:zinc ribbon domain-containing protein [Desulfobacteraceae bacterium]